jgi:hypothetical protein
MEGDEAMDSRKFRIGVIRRSSSMCVLWIIVIILAVAPAPFVPSAQAQSPNAERLGGLEEGEITGVGSTTLEVRGTTYRLHQRMTLKDDAGRPVEWSQLRPGLIVQYQLKEGALYKIIVLVPR